MHGDVRVLDSHGRGGRPAVSRTEARMQRGRKGEEMSQGCAGSPLRRGWKWGGRRRSVAAGIAHKRQRPEMEGTARFARVGASQHAQLEEGAQELEAETRAASVCLRAAGVDGELDGGAPAGDEADADGGVGGDSGTSPWTSG